MLSCPPMSSTVRAWGAIQRTPLPWQVISVTRLFAEETDFLPYPVATTGTDDRDTSPVEEYIFSSACRALSFGLQPVGSKTASAIPPSKRTAFTPTDPMSIPMEK
mgnify:CR=1 FL=1